MGKTSLSQECWGARRNGGTVEGGEEWGREGRLWGQGVHYGLKVKRSGHGSPGECAVDRLAPVLDFNSTNFASFSNANS